MKIEHVLTAQMVLPTSRYTKPEERIAFFNQVESRLEQLRGVDAVGLSDSVPPGGWERSRPLSSLEIVGRPRQEGGTGGLIDLAVPVELQSMIQRLREMTAAVI